MELHDIPAPVTTEITFFLPYILVRYSEAEQIHRLLNKAVQVRLRNREENLWSVIADGLGVLTTDGEIEIEPGPSHRDDKFLKRTRFTQEEAIRRAREFIAKHERYIADR